MSKKSVTEGIVFYLSNCDTCIKILKKMDGAPEFIRQDIKTTPLSKKQWNELHALAGSYEALFSRRAQLYKEWNLKERTPTEEEIRDLLYQHYTFLKRPVFVLDGKIWIGNAPVVTDSLNEYLLKRRQR